MKKQPRKTLRDTRYFEIEGNNGGSYITLLEEKEGVVTIEVGHDCVRTMRHTISVFALAAALSRVNDTVGFRQLLSDYYDGKAPSWAEPV